MGIKTVFVAALATISVSALVAQPFRAAGTDHVNAKSIRSHAANRRRRPVRRLPEIRVPVSPEQTEQRFGDDASADRAQLERLFVAFAALGGCTLYPFVLRFGEHVVPERRPSDEARMD